MGRYKFAILAVMAILVTSVLALVFFTGRLETDSTGKFGDLTSIRRPPPASKQAPAPGEEPSPDDGVTADAAPPESPPKENVTPDVLSTFRVHYGINEGEIGLIEAAESPLGPTSFSVDAKGTWYIADSVKRRVAIFASDGKYQRSVAVQGSIDDITVSDAGALYVLDAADKVLRKYNVTGKYSGRADAGTILGAPAGIRSTNEKIFVVSDRQYQAEVTIDGSKGRLLPAALGFSDSAKKGKRLTVEVNEGTATLFMASKAGAAPREVELDIDQVASASILRIDTTGHIYLQIERFLPDYAIGLKVYRLTPNGAVLSVTDVRNDVYTWTSKMVEVDEEGNIYQAIPTKNGVRFKIWSR